MSENQKIKVPIKSIKLPLLVFRFIAHHQLVGFIDFTSYLTWTFNSFLNHFCDRHSNFTRQKFKSSKIFFNRMNEYRKSSKNSIEGKSFAPSGVQLRLNFKYFFFFNRRTETKITKYYP